jgi:large subunit ribosomal protein L19
LLCRKVIESIQEENMSQHPIMERLAAKLQRKDLPEIKPGDTVRVQVKIKEGDKERVQAFEGTVISLRNGPGGSFTVRKVSFGQGVERIFPFNSKVIDKVEIVRSNQVRRAKLFYLRALKGKAARLREIDRVQTAAPVAEAAESQEPA